MGVFFRVFSKVFIKLNFVLFLRYEVEIHFFFFYINSQFSSYHWLKDELSPFPTDPQCQLCPTFNFLLKGKYLLRGFRFCLIGLSSYSLPIPRCFNHYNLIVSLDFWQGMSLSYSFFLINGLLLLDLCIF